MMDEHAKPLFWSDRLSATCASSPRTFETRSDTPSISRSEETSIRTLRGFSGAGVLEVVEDYQGDTYRAIYTVRFRGRVYALHAFQKKSKRGIKTPKQDIDRVKERLRWAAELHQAWMKEQEGRDD